MTSATRSSPGCLSTYSVRPTGEREPRPRRPRPGRQGAIGAAADTTPITIAPQFAGLGTAPFALAAGSALVDAGSDTPLAQDESAWDLSGKPRVYRRQRRLHRAPRPGAYETAAGPACPATRETPDRSRPRPPPPARGHAGRHAQVPTRPPTAPRRSSPSSSCTRAKLTFRLSEAATVKRHGAAQAAAAATSPRARSARRAAREQNSVALRLRAGHYRVLVDAVDLAGNRVSVRRRSVRRRPGGACASGP